MDSKYQKEWSKALGRTVWFVETPGIAYAGGRTSDTYHVSTLLRMKGTKKHRYFIRFWQMLEGVFFKLKTSWDPIKKYLNSIRTQRIKDSEIVSQMKDIYSTIKKSEERFDRGAGRAALIEKLLLQSKANPIKTYFDYGCGEGDFTKAIGTKLNILDNTHCADIIEYSSLKGLNFQKITSPKINHPDNTFDLITVSNVLHHVPDSSLLETVQELNRILSPTGTLILREHNVQPDEAREMTLVIDFAHVMYDDILSVSLNWQEEGEYYSKYKSLEGWDKLFISTGFSLNDFRPNYNPVPKFNPIAQYMRVYNKVSLNDMFESKTPEFFRIVTDKIPRKKYHRRNREVKNTLHWGQRKLLLSEIEFLTLFLQSETYLKNPEKPVYIIYAGSSPGTHIKYLWKLFPKVYFVLYDPRDFDPILTNEPTEHIQTHVQLFLDETAEEWVSSEHADKHILLVSDIRTAEPETMEKDEVERHIYQDNSWQKQWWMIMEPAMAMFKFRLPWDDKTTEYPEGDIYLQIFPPLTSTETRLVIHSHNASPKNYNHRDYEERMFHFNTVERENTYDNPLSAIPTDKKEGLDNKYDSVSEIHVLGNYLRLTEKDDSPKEIIKISKEISKKLSKGRTLESDQPLKKYSREIVRKLKAKGEIPGGSPFTRTTYHKYVIGRYDELVASGDLDPNVDEGGVSM
jgi:2-polyprenyl-3-methyl-5-hydroxy-6-metoxy-1,4-benzoquinol methylase